MNSKHYTTVGGKRRKHLHLDVPQAFIPELAWFKVMLYVATQSSEDLFCMACVCPLLNTLANTPQVWNTISMEKYQDHPNWYYASTQGNVEALSGMRVAATAGHMEASYLVELLGMSGIGQSREDALKFLCSLNQRNNIDMKGTRDALRRRLSEIFFVGRHIVDMFHYGKIKFNQCSACNNNDWCFVIPGWPSEEKINPAFWTCCNRCKWHRESVFWFKVMHVYVVPGNPYPYN
ncbi:unnamed protein product [Prunus armeniaca]